MGQKLSAEESNTEEPNAEKYYKLGKLCVLLGGGLDEAIIHFEQAIKLDPNYIEAYLEKAATLLYLGRKEEAIECLDICIKIEPDNFITYLMKGDILFALGKNEEAIKAFDKVIELKPDYAKAYINKSANLIALGKNEEVIKACDKVIEFKPDFDPAYYNKGLALLDLGLIEEAIKCFDKCIEFVPNHALYYCVKGKILNALGKEYESLEYFNKAYELSKTGNLDANLSKDNMDFINEVLLKDREALLKKLIEVQETTVEVENKLSKLNQDKPEVKKAIQEFNSLKEQSKAVTDKVIDSIDLSKAKDVTHEINTDLLKILTELKAGQEKIMKDLAGVKEEIKTEISYQTEVIVKYGKLNLEATEKAASSLKKKILENTKASKHDKETMNSLINGIEEKMKSLVKQEDVSTITEQMKKLLTQGEVTKKRLLAIEEDIDNLIERQGKTDERLEKLELFNKVTDNMIQRLKGDIKLKQTDKDTISSLIKGIEEKIQSLASMDVILDITDKMRKLSKEGEVTKKRLVTLEEYIDELIDKQEGGSKAEVFMVTDIVYDNLLLNHPALLKDAAKCFGMSKAIDLSNQLSPSFMLDAIETNDSELLLAGMMSIQSNYNQ